MNVQNMAKGMNEVQLFRVETSDHDEAEVVLASAYYAIQQQLAAAREEIRVYQMFEQLVIGEGAWERFNDLRNRAESAEAEAKAARDVAEAWNAEARADGYGGGSAKGREILDAMNATLQRDRQP